MLFGWRRRNEGFEWREHVRTTILVRRADRQKKVDEARLAALAKVKDARDRGLDAGKRQIDAARDQAAGIAHKAGEAVAGAARAGAGKALDGGRHLAQAAAHGVAALPRPAAPAILKRSAADALMYAADVPRRWRLLKPYLLPAAGAGAAIFVFGAALTPRNDGASALVETGSITRVAGNPAANDGVAETGILTGRATAVAGDLLRVRGTLVKLAGIDAPQVEQSCFRANGRRWDCGAAATSALRRLIRSQRIACELKAPAGDRLSPTLAHCRAGQTDIAAALVRRGDVFANSDLGRPYAAEEDDAKAAKAGVWQGSAERPQDWRTRIWEEAKKASPDGCPIKGHVGSGRIYTMPWSRGYASREIRAGRGDRWFCSEEDARAAGFRILSQPGQG